MNDDPFAQFEKNKPKAPEPAGLNELMVSAGRTAKETLPTKSKPMKKKAVKEKTILVSHRLPVNLKNYVEGLAGHNGIKSFSDAMRTIIEFYKSQNSS